MARGLTLRAEAEETDVVLRGAVLLDGADAPREEDAVAAGHGTGKRPIAAADARPRRIRSGEHALGVQRTVRARAAGAPRAGAAGARVAGRAARIVHTRPGRLRDGRARRRLPGQRARRRRGRGYCGAAGPRRRGASADEPRPAAGLGGPGHLVERRAETMGAGAEHHVDGARVA